MIFYKSQILSLIKRLNDDDANIKQDDFMNLEQSVNDALQEKGSEITLGEFVDLLQNLAESTKAFLNPLNPLLLDRWLLRILQDHSLVFKDPALDEEGLVGFILCVALENNLTLSAKFMTTHKIGIDVVSTSDKQTPLIYAIDYFKQETFDSILQSSSSLIINQASSNHETALLRAIHADNRYAFDALLQIPHLIVVDDERNVEICAEAKKKQDPYYFNKLLENVEGKVNSYTNILSLKHLPLADFSVASQQSLIPLIEMETFKNSVFKNNKELKKRFLDFVNDTRPLGLKHLDRITIAIQCLHYLAKPSLIKQKGNTCGPASLMQHLAEKNPELFIYSVIELAELTMITNDNAAKEKTHLPKGISVPETIAAKSNTLGKFWVHTIRDHYNVIFGYSPDSNVEFFKGVTLPYQIGKMFSDFGYIIESENIQIRFTNTNMPGLFFENARQKIQSNISFPEPLKMNTGIHDELSEEDRFQYLCEWFQKFPKDMVCVMVNTELTNSLFRESRKLSFYGLIESSHFMNIKNFSVNNNSVAFTCYTWGQAYDCRMLISDFKKGYLGGIFVKLNNNQKEESQIITNNQNQNQNTIVRMS